MLSSVSVFCVVMMSGGVPVAVGVVVWYPLINTFCST